MAATRKLQDRCLKKVTEGVETFEDIWQKVHNATNSNQKEKYEADLKKEIKKLQRLRDQIKSWIASGEIKDKSTLLEFRKLIETQMERFKVVERETKTKAYSKEGLGAAQKMDPAQKEREEISAWLVSSIDALNLQVDQFESEIESLLVGKKKRLDKEKHDRMEELKSKLEKHRFHIKKLETLLRMLDNMSVEVDQIRRIKDDVEYYIDSSQEPGFEENEYIYDDIRGLDEVELTGVGVPSSAATDSNSGGSPNSIASGGSPTQSPVMDLLNHTSDSIDIEKKKKEELIAKPVKPLPLRAVNNSVLNNSTSNISSLLNNSTVTTNSINATSTTALSTPNKIPLSPSPLRNNNTEVVENGPVTPVPLAPLVTHLPHLTNTQPQPSLQTTKSTTETTSSPVTVNGPVAPHAPNAHLINTHLINRVENDTGVSPELVANPVNPAASAASGTATLKSIAQEAVQRAGLDSVVTQERRIAVTEAHIPPLLGVAPLGLMPLTNEHQQHTLIMEKSAAHMPHPSDSERTRPHLPRSICPTPQYYQQMPLPHTDSIEFFQRLATETLFFIFYYMEGTKAQYLAAKALKKQSWRFHTKYMMWFQRHEEPKVINEEYEQGTYIYFDYEKWGQRKKEGFTFEYKYLEDRDLN